MSYFGGSGRIAGDPGFFDVFKGIVGLGKRALGFTPIGLGLDFVSSQFGPKKPPTFTPPFTGGISVGGSIPSVSGPPRSAAGTAQGRGFVNGAAWPTNKDGSPRRAKRDGTPWKRPTMNPTNPKALMRAARRADSFVRVARRVLKNTGWKITSKSSGKMTQAAWEKKAHNAK